MLRFATYAACLALAAAARHAPTVAVPLLHAPSASKPAPSQAKPPAASVLKPQRSLVTPIVRPGYPVRLGGIFTRGLGAGTLGDRLSPANSEWVVSHCDVACFYPAGIEPSTFTRMVAEQRAFTPLLFVSAAQLSSLPGSVGKWQPGMAPWCASGALGIGAHNVHMMDITNREWVRYWGKQVYDLLGRYQAMGIVASDLPVNAAREGPALARDAAGPGAAATAAWLGLVHTPSIYQLVPAADGFNQVAGHPTLPLPDAQYEPELRGRLWDEYAPITDGAWMSQWLRSAQTGVPDTERVWEIEMEAADRAAKFGQVFIACAPYHSTSELEYALASYLLVAHRQGRLVFQPMPLRVNEPRSAGYSLAVMQRELKTHSELFDAPLASAFQQRHLVPSKAGHLWRRAYRFGTVYVNSADSGTATVDFGGPMMRLNGFLVRHLSLPPHTGVIVMNASTHR